MRVLITGGAGFIGSALARVLAERGDAVTTLDDGSRGFRGSPGVRSLSGDVMDYRAVRSAMAAQWTTASCPSMAEFDIG